jgi:hypothetical protein
VRVDPMNPTLKAPGIKVSKLKYDKPLSRFAFKSNFRRYILDHVSFGNMVGRCRLTLSDPR